MAGSAVSYGPETCFYPFCKKPVTEKGPFCVQHNGIFTNDTAKQKLKQRGICISCRQPAPTRCQKCLKILRAQAAKTREPRAAMSGAEDIQAVFNNRDEVDEVEKNRSEELIAWAERQLEADFDMADAGEAEQRRFQELVSWADRQLDAHFAKAEAEAEGKESEKKLIEAAWADFDAAMADMKVNELN